MFNLNGCPLDFVSAMARLAKLAAIHETTLQMEWTIFNRFPVDTIIEEVRNYTNHESVTFEDMEYLEEDPDARRNRYHCIEAWRHAILLYTCRAFTSKQDDYGLRQISQLSRIILDSVRCIPLTNLLQKQLLLPVFLAAAEMGSEVDRSFARRYCKHWSDVSGYYHFESAAMLLEDIWRDWDLSTRMEYWWGLKVGGGAWTSAEDSPQSLVSEVLLG